MPIITLFCGSYCKEDKIIKEICSQTGFRLVSDDEIVAEASHLCNIPQEKIKKVFSNKISVFNRFTREKERSLAYLRAVLAKKLTQDKLIINGFAGQLIPKNINHILRVCLIADMQFRIGIACKAHGVEQPEALKIVHRKDETSAAWMHMLYDSIDPWSPDLYDITFPTDKKTAHEICNTIKENISKSVITLVGRSGEAVRDFNVAANVEVALADKGHVVDVDACEGSITLTINKHVLRLNRLEEELRDIAIRVDGVKSVEAKVGPGYYQADVYRRQDFKAPSKILLVDDEKKYVQTLSKRLMMRELESAVVYDGESALELTREDEPDVMILDLRMPGIDGIEVLRNVKKNKPEIEVIVLTSQGSEADKKNCMELGAFAFLSKSVDIDELSKTIKAAKDKIHTRRLT